METTSLRKSWIKMTTFVCISDTHRRHESYGRHTMDNGTLVLNVARMNKDYKPVNRPVVVSL